MLGCAVVAVGLALRLWLVFHRPLTSDEAIVGLMAHQIRHGQVFTFYWGQSYGGVEPYLVAAWTAIVGSGPVALNSVPVVLSAVTALLVWRVCRRILPGEARILAPTAGIAVWVWPEGLIFNSTTELGFRGAALLAGVALLLFALRSAESPELFDLAALGLVAGIGWWASPEMAYFVVPAAGIVIAGWSKLRVAGWRLLLLPATAVLGAGPWLATNIRTGFLSLQASSSPDYIRSSYPGRLGTFFDKTLPMMLGLRLPLRGSWVWGHGGQALYLLALVVLVAACSAALAGAGLGEHRGHLRALGAGVVVFPFIFAAFPATSFWLQGQYGVYIVPLVVLLLGGVAGGLLAPGPRRRLHLRRSPSNRLFVCGISAVTLIALSVNSMASFNRAWLSGHSTFLADWSGPSRTAERVVAELETAGVHTAYAEYWVAYSLDYLSHERLKVTAPYADRWVAEYHQVHSSPDPAWLFFAPSQLVAAQAAFSSTPPGPFGYTESLFEAKLNLLRIYYQVKHVGVIDAVIPDHTVTPAEVGIPNPFWS